MNKEAEKNRRRGRRSMVESLFTTIQLGGVEYRAQVADVSEGGMRLILPDSVSMSLKDTIKISIDQVMPSIRGKVRWISDPLEGSHERVLGVQFETVEIRSLDKTSIDGNLDLPIESPLSNDAFGRFLGVLVGIDHRIIEGEIEDLSEAALAASAWIERTVGPHNVWYVIKGTTGELSIQPMVDRGHGLEAALPERTEKIRMVAEMLGSFHLEEISYHHGEPLVLEFFCGLKGQEDAVEKIARAFGSRTHTWSKLIIKNIALKFIGDELENRIKERTQELEISLQLANQANQSKTDFLSNISHELRTPLNGILGMAQFIDKGYAGNLNLKQAEYVGDILLSGRHLLSLIEDILDISSVESGNLKQSVSEIPVQRLLSEVVHAFRMLAREKSITLKSILPEALDDLKVSGDERLLKQVLFNLVSNAIKFTPEGGSVTLDAEQNQNNLHISVSDNGPGIPAAEHEKIFDRFYQVHKKPYGKNPGVGLGLSLCRTFAELHHGKVRVESDGEGQGSRFVLEIPLPERA